MNEYQTYTLTELAEQCGLTGRTTRYYIEQVLPPHHKQGRGKLARYGQDTFQCIRFITLVKERYGIKPGQSKGVLASVGQATIDRVVRGEEDLAVMTVPSGPAKTGGRRAGARSRASAREDRYFEKEHRQIGTASVPVERADFSLDADLGLSDAGSEFDALAAFPEMEPEEPWQTVFSDAQLRIHYHGKRHLTQHQAEQIEAAARLIELALKYQ